MKRIKVPPAVKAEFDRLNEVLKDAEGEWHNHILSIVIGYIECFAKMHGIEWIEADAALRSHKGDLIEEYKEEDTQMKSIGNWFEALCAFILIWGGVYGINFLMWMEH